MKNSWKLNYERVKRAKWPILALGVVAAVAAGIVVAVQPTVYTGWATLTTGSPNRAPDQDGVLSSAYVDYFNSAGYQGKLKESAGISDDIALSAKTAAAGPIIYVEAKSESVNAVAKAAPAAATAFQDEINGQLRAAQDETIAALRKPFDDAREANGVVSQVAFEQLQDRINQVNADTSNKLITLQLNSGVTAKSFLGWQNVLFALLAGLLIGCIAVITAATVSRRVRTGAELTAKTGLSPIVEVPAGRTDAERRVRAQRLQQLVNAVGLAVGADKRVVTVTSTVRSASAMRVARALAQGRAAQGSRTVLVNADLHAPGGYGVGDIIDSDSVDMDKVIVPTATANLSEISAGTSNVSPFEAVTYQRIGSLIARIGDRADYIVILAPPVTEAAEAQVLCAAADAALLVVDAEESRSGDCIEAVTLLEATDAKLIGSVLIAGGSTDFADSELGITDQRVRRTAEKALENGNGQHADVVAAGGIEWHGPSSTS